MCSSDLAAVIILAIIVGMVILVIILNDAVRKIPVQYAKKVQGRKMVGGQSTFIPLKVNTAGVIPVIFAQSILQIPIIISQLTGYKGTGPWAYILRGLNSRSLRTEVASIDVLVPFAGLLEGTKTFNLIRATG